MKKPFSLIVLFFAIAFSTYSQDNINFFLDCNQCDQEFMRQELNFVSFVQNQLQADVHVLVTTSRTGSGGSVYYLNFIGNNGFEGMDYSYEVTMNESDTDDAERNKFLNVFQIGVLQYYFQTDLRDQLDVNIESLVGSTERQMLYDPWDKWILSLDVSGAFRNEETRDDFSIDNEIEIKKTTDEWKTQLEASYGISRENYYRNDEKISNNQDSKDFRTSFTKSLTDRWSARVLGEYSSTPYRNFDNSYEAAAGIEYNIYPWNESHRRIFAFRYNLIYGYYDYLEETIYDQFQESLLKQSLEVNLKFVRPWGDLSAGLEGSHYFHDFDKYRLEFQSRLSYRVSKNVSFYVRFNADLIHDQLYLVKGDTSMEDLLLRRRQLATAYQTSGQFGVRFTFGSIYDNIVNERFVPARSGGGGGGGGPR